MTPLVDHHRYRRHHRTAATRATWVLILAALTVALGTVSASPAVAATGTSPTTTTASAPAAGGTGRATFGIGPASGSGPDGRSAFNFDVTRGAHLTDRLAVVNFTDQPVVLTAYPVDAEPDDRGGAQLPPAGVKPVAAGSWFHLSLAPGATVPVGAKATVILPFTVEVPVGATAGDHEAALIASLSTYALNKQGTRVRVDQRIAVRAYVRVAGALEPRLEVQQLHVSYHAGANPVSGTVTASYLVRNTGNVRLGAVQHVSVHELFGSTSSAIPPAIPVLPPGASQHVSVRISGVLAEVHGRVEVRLQPVGGPGDVDGTLVPVEASRGVWTVPWLLIAALVVIALAWFLVRRWRRRRPRGGSASPVRPAGPREVVHA